MPAMQLTERAEQVLNRLISRYISDGAPVGSHTLAREGGLDLSAATIRTVMADLEAHGLVEAPHTSAGRIPTQRGYRVFVGGLLGAGMRGGMRAAIDKLNQRARAHIEERILDAPDRKSILTRATEMLSQITSFAGIVSIPAARTAHIRRVEFLRLSQRRVLAILITDDGQVQNRILNAGIEYTESELRDAADVFNENYSSRTLRDVRAELLAHMRRERRSMHREMRTAINIARQLFEDDLEARENVLVSGENNLLAVPDFGEMERLKQLFDTFKTKQALFDLLQKSMFADGVNIFIGEESGCRMLRDCSVIAAPYEIERRKAGVLGVIGPTRMHYDEVITAVDITAQLLSSALSADARRH
ncbi:MAG: heat-inducible transcriptional repressor HrcA [Gammaproteobacteria bacterium]